MFKNVRTDGLLITALLVLLVAAVAAIFWGVSGTAATLMNDELRADVLGIMYVVALVYFFLNILLANDENTSILSKVMTVLFFTVGVIVVVAGQFYNSVGKQINDVPELVEPGILLVWVLPVVIGILFFTHHALDYFWGETKVATLGRQEHPKTSALNGILYYIGLVIALAASALGTYDLMFALTGSAWHALLYVGTVEIAIFYFSHYTTRTDDPEMFWYMFSATLGVFVVAFIFQAADAVLKLNGGLNVDNTAQNFARQFVSLPPLLVGGLAGALFAVNYRKKTKLFQKQNSGKAQADKPAFQPSSPFRRPDRPAPQDSQRQESFSESSQSPQSQSGSRPQGQQQPHGNSPHGKGDFAEPGGLDEQVVAQLKELGYSGNAIRQMNAKEAQNRVDKKIAPNKPPQSSPKPPAPSGVNGNGKDGVNHPKH